MTVRRLALHLKILAGVWISAAASVIALGYYTVSNTPPHRQIFLLPFLFIFLAYAVLTMACAIGFLKHLAGFRILAVVISIILALFGLWSTREFIDYAVGGYLSYGTLIMGPLPLGLAAYSLWVLLKLW